MFLKCLIRQSVDACGSGSGGSGPHMRAVYCVGEGEEVYPDTILSRINVSPIDHRGKDSPSLFHPDTIQVHVSSLTMRESLPVHPMAPASMFFYGYHCMYLNRPSCSYFQ